MEKSLFAGLTVLDEDESILEDAGAFVGRDREIIDRLLEIGAKTHRHDGHAGLLDPVQPLTASAVASAGTLPGDLTFSIGYTLEDDDRGETLISPLVTMTTPPVIERPLFAPTGVISYVAGDLPTDTYYYAMSWTDAEGGETNVGPSVSVEREPGFANGQVDLSGLTNGMVAAGAAGWRLYRAVGGGDFHYLTNGVGDTFTDDGSIPVQPDMQPLPEGVNTTNNDNGVLLQLPSGDVRVAESSFINVYMSEDGTFSGNVFLQQFPVSSAGQTVFYPSVTLFGEQPPDVNNSIGGASLIDPDTDLLDWHWKRPVPGIYALGSGTLGDVRIATDTGSIYGMLAASGSGAADWTELPSGGVAANFAVTDEDGPSVTPISELEFIGSGGAVVEVTDEGGGLARVLVIASAGAGGGEDTAPGPMPADFVAPYDPMLVQNAVAVPGANQARACLVIIPRDGNLRDLHVWSTVAAGNIEGAVYDPENPRALLWSSGSFAHPGGGVWVSLGDPDLPVSKGDRLYLVIAADNTTATFGRQAALGNEALNRPPVSWGIGIDGGTPKRAVTIASFTPGSAPATISEADMVSTTFAPCIIGRIT